MESLPSIEHLLTAQDVKRMLKVSLATIYNLAGQGRLPCVRWDCPGEGTKKPRTMVRFKVSDVYEFIEKHYRNS